MFQASNFNNLLSEVIESQPYPLMFLTISGAHLYGFPSADSDYDLRGVHILPIRKVIGMYPVRETIELSETESGLEIDLVTHDLKKFFTLLLKKNGYVLEQLYSPLIIKTTPEHRKLKEIASNCITRHHYHHYRGFAKSQWDLFTKENIYRIKPLLYIYRVLLTGIHLMNTGKIEANLVNLNEKFQLPYLADLIDRKTTESEKPTLEEINLEFHHQEYKRLQNELETAFLNSHLPDTPSAQPELNSFLVNLRVSCLKDF